MISVIVLTKIKIKHLTSVQTPPVMQFTYTSLVETVMELLENLNLSQNVNVQIMLPKIEVKALQIYCLTNNPCYTVYSCIT